MAELATKVTPEGAAGFSVLTEPRGFKGSEENRSFSQEIMFSHEEAMKFIDELQAEANRLHALEIEKQKRKGSSARFAAPVINFKELQDGRVSLNFKRKESEGFPKVVDADNNQFKGYVRRENKIRIAYQVKPYMLPTRVFGVSLILVGVKVIEGGNSVDLSKVFGGTAKVTTKEETSVADLF
jgi:hypothetical protein